MRSLRLCKRFTLCVALLVIWNYVGLYSVAQSDDPPCNHQIPLSPQECGFAESCDGTLFDDPNEGCDGSEVVSETISDECVGPFGDELLYTHCVVLGEWPCTTSKPCLKETKVIDGENWFYCSAENFVGPPEPNNPTDDHGSSTECDEELS